MAKLKKSTIIASGGIALVATIMGASLLWAAADRFPVSVEELQARGDAAFAKADEDGDGLITPAEFAAHEPDHHFKGHRYTGHRDTDHRGTDHHDGDHRSWGRSTHQPDQDQDALSAGGRDGRRAEMGAEWRDKMDRAVFIALDIDRDGVLSDEEFSSEKQRHARTVYIKQIVFIRLDSNLDGVLTPEEFPPRRLADLDVDGDGLISRDEMRNGMRHLHTDAG